MIKNEILIFLVFESNYNNLNTLYNNKKIDDDDMINMDLKTSSSPIITDLNFEKIFGGNFLFRKNFFIVLNYL